MTDERNDVYTVTAKISKVFWKKKFCLLPQISTTSGNSIWLKYAYRGYCVISIPSRNIYTRMEMWQTPEEHTGWVLGDGDS